MDKQEIKIYRILHIENLHLLLQAKGLNSPNSIPNKQRSSYKNIYNTEIQSDRGNITVPHFPNATIHDFIPFYFCPASPMLYAITKGQYGIPSDDIIYLVADALEIAKENTFVFTNCNARLRFVEWFYDINDIPKLEWKCINARYWGRLNDPSGFTKQYKMAEFLVKDWLEWRYIQNIATNSKLAYEKVMGIMSRYCDICHKTVIVKPEWYY